MYPEADEVHIGGSGYNNCVLPDEVEHIMPDYNLYNCNYSLGFTTRGCCRKCPWCIVPEKEGKTRANADIYEFWHPKHKHIILLDNNILALPDHFRKISSQLMEEDLTVDFNQGLDIRLVNDKTADILSQLRIKPRLRFSFDEPSMKDLIKEKIKLLKRHDIGQCSFYVLVDFNTSKKQDRERLELLKELGQRAYVMRYNKSKDNRYLNDLAAWANQPRFFADMPFKKFRVLRANRNIGYIGDHDSRIS
jgi:hypothetical protein